MSKSQDTWRKHPFGIEGRYVALESFIGFPGSTFVKGKPYVLKHVGYSRYDSCTVFTFHSAEQPEGLQHWWWYDSEPDLLCRERFELATCNTCSEVQRDIRIEKMRSDQIFAALDVLVSRGALSDLGETDPDSPWYEVAYMCKECGAQWLFAVPDHAFRGWFIRKTPNKFLEPTASSRCGSD